MKKYIKSRLDLISDFYMANGIVYTFVIVTPFVATATRSAMGYELSLGIFAIMFGVLGMIFSPFHKNEAVAFVLALSLSIIGCGLCADVAYLDKVNVEITDQIEIATVGDYIFLTSDTDQILYTEDADLYSDESNPLRVYRAHGIDRFGDQSPRQLFITSDLMDSKRYLSPVKNLHAHDAK